MIAKSEDKDFKVIEAENEFSYFPDCIKKS
jgi:hypothetical protein